MRSTARALFSVLALVAGTLGGGSVAQAGTGIPVPADATRVVEATATIRDDLAPLIRATQDQIKIPAMSMVLVRGKEVLWAEGFGLADVSGKIAATPDTLYRAGSLAKPLTAIAVMQLAEDGRIDIDQPLAASTPRPSRSRCAACSPITRACPLT
jgi:CubicO group peptidase (beta-lactamase class C family)